MAPRISQQAQVRALVAKQTPAIRAAFLAAIQQAHASLDYAALLSAIRFNDLGRVVELLRIDASSLFPLEEAIRTAVIEGGVSVVAPRALAGAFSFSGRHPRAERIIAEMGARLVTEIGSPGVEPIRALLLAGQQQGIGAERIARQLAGTINKVTGIREGGIMGLDAPRAARSKAVRDILSDPARVKEYFAGGKPRYTSTDRRFDASVRRAIKDGVAMPAADVEKITRAHDARLLKARGDTIARDQAFTAQAQGRREAYVQMRDMPDVESIEKTWDHASLKDPRPDHQLMNGVTVDLDAPFIMDDGTEMQHPHDPNAGPGQNLGCRCSVIYNPKFRKDDARLNSAASFNPGPESTHAPTPPAPLPSRGVTSIDDYTVVGREGDFTYAENKIPHYRPNTIEGVQQSYRHDVSVLDEIRELSIGSDVKFGERVVSLDSIYTAQSTVRLENLRPILENFDRSLLDTEKPRLFVLPDGTRILKDGNHRVNAAMANGVTEMTFDTIEFTARVGRMSGYDVE